MKFFDYETWFVIVFAFVLWLAVSITAQAQTCNQKVYDELYQRIVRHNFNDNIERLKQINKYGATVIDESVQDQPEFQIIRTLCNQQLTSFEAEESVGTK